MVLWLHKMGYNYFNIPKLTYPEIGALVDAKNRQNKSQKRESDRQAKKSKQRFAK